MAKRVNKELVLKMLNDGDKYDYIAAINQCHVQTVYRIASQNGIKRHLGNDEVQARRERARELKASGYGIKQIAKIMNCSLSTAAYSCYKNNARYNRTKHENSEKIIEMAKKGKTAGQIAYICGCSTATAYRYKNAER